MPGLDPRDASNTTLRFVTIIRVSRPGESYPEGTGMPSGEHCGREICSLWESSGRGGEPELHSRGSVGLCHEFRLRMRRGGGVGGESWGPDVHPELAQGNTDVVSHEPPHHQSAVTEFLMGKEKEQLSKWL